MILKTGDKIYLKPNQKIQETTNELLDKPFEIISTRQRIRKGSMEGDDICIKWIDDTPWWWGQYYETQPWTDMFISEKSYLRNKKLESLGI